MDPHCISSGHTLSQYHHGSATYLLASIGMPTSGLEHILTLFDGYIHLILGSPTPYPCFEESTKCFSQQISFSVFTLRGESCYTSKFLTSIMSHSHCRKCNKFHTFVTSSISVSFSFCKHLITNDTMKTLDTTPKTCYKKNPHHLTVETKVFL
jgi:hypothetical protein